MLKRKNGKKDLPLATVLTGLGVSISALLLCALTASIISFASKDPTAILPMLSLSALLLSGALSSALNARMRGTVCALTAAATATVLILIVGLILSGGALSPAALMNCGCYVGVSALITVLSKGRTKRARHTRRR